MSVEVGRKLILWRIDRIRKGIWVDSFRDLRPVYVVGEQIPVSVTEAKIIFPSPYPKGSQVEKLTAVSADGTVYIHKQREHQRGDVVHLCLWTDGEGEFVEACCAYNNRIVPFVDEDCEIVVPLEATICDIHGYAYMPDDPAGCLYC